VFLIHENCARHVSALILVLTVAGCASRQRSFSDITERERHQPTQAMASAQPVAEKESVRPVPSTNTIPRTPVAATTARPIITPSTRNSIAMNLGPGSVVTREWSQSVCYRVSGDVVSGSTYWPSIDSALKRNEFLNLVMEPGEFIFNLCVMPIRMVITPPWAQIDYSAVGPPNAEFIETSGLRYLEPVNAKKRPEGDAQSVRFK